MKKTNKQVKTNSVGKAIAVGVSIATATAAAYLLFGPDAKKNRKIVRGWAVKMKGDIIEKFEKTKDLTESTYHNIIDQVSAKYAKVKGVDTSEIESIVQDARKYWKAMAGATKKKAVKKVKEVKKTVKEVKKALSK